MSTPADWTAQFAGLAHVPADIRTTLQTQGRVISVPAGTVIFGPGKAPDNLLLLLNGTVRVQQVSESGREIVLYRVSSGESCVLTTACLLAYEDYAAEGIAESDVEAVAIPKHAFEDLVSRSPEFRRFVFQAYSTRITSLFRLIDEVAFSRIDIRLAQRILDLADSDGRLTATQQQLANELGSAREVISRQLQEFQRRQWLEIARGSLSIKDRGALERLAAEG